MNVSRVRFILTYRALQTADQVLRVIEHGHPPTLIPRSERDDDYRGLKKYWDLQNNWNCPTWLEYTLLIFREPRYDSFRPNYARTHKTTTATTTWVSEVRYMILSTLVIGSMERYFPNRFTAALVAALGIYIYFTLTVFLMTPYSTPPFSRPFSASSISEFWSVRWHAMLHSPLHTIFYKPTLKFTQSRSVSVVVTFTASGFWHAIGVEPILGRECAAYVTLFFILQGVGVILDQGLFGTRNVIQRRLLAWIYILATASVMVDVLQVATVQRWKALVLLYR